MTRLTQLHHELYQRTEVLGWTRTKTSMHLNGVYGRNSIDDLTYEQAHKFGAFLTNEWDRTVRENMARARSADAAVSDVPFIFRGRGAE